MVPFSRGHSGGVFFAFCQGTVVSESRIGSEFMLSKLDCSTNACSVISGIFASLRSCYRAQQPWIPEKHEKIREKTKIHHAWLGPKNTKNKEKIPKMAENGEFCILCIFCVFGAQAWMGIFFFLNFWYFQGFRGFLGSVPAPQDVQVLGPPPPTRTQATGVSLVLECPRSVEEGVLNTQGNTFFDTPKTH